ncbi:MAG: hypothetical protein FVQ79_04810 [Planctomycetes bacterium]|nr:hypothetical protein [Planctomycetota bacterium]
MVKKFVLMVFVLCAFGMVPSAFGDDVYYYVSLNKLKIENGKLPASISVDESLKKIDRSMRSNMEKYVQPYAVGSNAEEIYLRYEPGRRSRNWNIRQPISSLISDTFMAIRTTMPGTPSGILYVPKADFSGMERLEFSLDRIEQDQEAARKNFLDTKENHYERLLRLRGAGAAWYRHQIRQTQIAREGKAKDDANDGRTRPARQSQLQRTFAMFSGGRAISENLQLDRQLRVTSAQADLVDVNSIEGVTITEIDWSPLIAGKNPAKDPLARLIPADQYAVFFPTFKKMITVLDELEESSAPFLRLAVPRAENAEIKIRYERQLCISLDRMVRIFGPTTIARVAYTGSDPYLPTGSDKAVLFGARSPKLVRNHIAGNQKEALKSIPGAKKVSGIVAGVAYKGVVSPDRMVCSYMATIGKVVVVTNSLFQLEQIVKAGKGRIPTMDSLDEYTFFRDRYKLGDDQETALLVLTDAAIRKWCSPKWRIAASRRLRAGAVMAQLQARHLDELKAANVKPARLILDKPIHGAGDIFLTAGGISSSVYGNLEFMTPIAELNLQKVTKPERDAYEQFRRNYQRRWRQFFDPIAVRFVVAGGKLAADVTVRPLIASSEYRQFMAVTGQTKITQDAGDRHDSSRLHFVMAMDKESPIAKQYSNFASMMAPNIGANALDWAGDWIAFYSEEDPFWDELAEIGKKEGAQKMQQFLERNYGRLPIALHIDVSSPLKVTGFLVALRAFIEQTAPGMTAWETATHEEKSYVKISPSEAAKTSMPEGMVEPALYYAVTGKSLLVTLNEGIIKRSLTRAVAHEKALEKGKTVKIKGKPWIGESMAIQAKSAVLETLQTVFRENINITLQSRSWANIQILNEWRRRYAQTDPVVFHRRFWQMRLVCPGGGKYVWNEKFKTMESTVFGHPGQPKMPEELPEIMRRINSVNLGLTFEDNGLRARAEIERKKK